MTWEWNTCLGSLREDYQKRHERAEIEQCFCVYAGVARASANVLEVPLSRCPASACEDMRLHGQADAGRCLLAVPREGEETMAESTNSLPPPRMMQSVAHMLPADGAVNVGDSERWLSLLGGGLLAMYLLRRSLGTVVLLCGAGALLYRGLQGQCALYQAMGVSTVAHDPQSASPPTVVVPDEQPRIVLAGS